MKTSRAMAVTTLLLASMTMVAQDAGPNTKASQKQHAKTMRIFGKVSEDGSRFVEAATGKVWIATNPNTLKGFEGQSVAVRGLIGSDNKIEVRTVKGQPIYSANWSDSAFHR